MTRRELVALLLVALPGVAWIRLPRCWDCGRRSSEHAVRVGLSCERCWKAACETRAKIWRKELEGIDIGYQSGSEWYLDTSSFRRYR